METLSVMQLQKSYCRDKSPEEGKVAVCCSGQQRRHTLSVRGGVVQVLVKPLVLLILCVMVSYPHDTSSGVGQTEIRF